jgi:hypothetical protein
MVAYELITFIQGGCKVSMKHDERLVLLEHAQKFPLVHYFSVGQLTKKFHF